MQGMEPTPLEYGRPEHRRMSTKLIATVIFLSLAATTYVLICSWLISVLAHA